MRARTRSTARSPSPSWAAAVAARVRHSSLPDRQVGAALELGELAGARVQGLELRRLEAQEIELADAVAATALEFGEVARQGQAALVVRAVGGGLLAEAGVGVEQGELAGGVAEALRLVLGADLDQHLGDGAERGEGDGHVVDPRLAAAGGGQTAAQDVLTVLRGDGAGGLGGGGDSGFDLEGGGDLGVLGARTDQLGLGAAAAQQVEGVQEQALARAGLAADHGQALRGREARLGDDDEILDQEFGEHARDHPQGASAPAPRARTSFLAGCVALQERSVKRILDLRRAFRRARPFPPWISAPGRRARSAPAAAGRGPSP